MNLIIIILSVFTIMCAAFNGQTEISHSSQKLSNTIIQRTVAQTENQKIVVFYSKIGIGHISAANGVKAAIEKENPNAEVILKDIWDFVQPAANSLREKFYISFIKLFPGARDFGYKKSMKAGAETSSLARFENYHKLVQKKIFIEYIRAVKPTAILAANYTSAETLRHFRLNGLFHDIPISWILTDYAEGYWPRVSKYLDKTFLPHPELKKVWLKRGVPEHRVEVTGMPLNPVLFENEANPKRFLVEEKLNPEVKTVVIAAGGEGQAPFTEIVTELTDKAKGEKLQIISVTAHNEKELAKLETLTKTSPENIKLSNHGFVAQEKLLGLIRASDLYITKAGGLSPTEGFALATPIIIYETLGGVEGVNADLFEKLEMGVISRSVKGIGQSTIDLLNDSALQKRMIKNQTYFRDNLNISKITDFLLSPKLSSSPPYAAQPKAALLHTSAETLAARDYIIANENDHIRLSTYVFELDATGLKEIQQLREARAKGIEISLFIDGTGRSPHNLQLSQNKAMISLLLSEGFNIKIYNPKTDLHMLNNRNHIKRLLGSSRMITGDRNIENAYYNGPQSGGHSYLSIDMWAEGSVVEFEKQHFDELMLQPGSKAPKAKATQSEIEAAKKRLLPYHSSKASTWTPEKLNLVKVKALKPSSDPVTMKFKKRYGSHIPILDMINSATKELIIMNAYILLTAEFQDAIKAAVERGVKVKLITNSKQTQDSNAIGMAWDTEKELYKKFGVEIVEYFGQQTLHVKAAQVDGKHTYIGSFNLDPRSQYFNLEAGLIAESEELAKRFKTIIKNIEPDLKPMQPVGTPLLNSCKRAALSVVRPLF